MKNFKEKIITDDGRILKAVRGTTCEFCCLNSTFVCDINCIDDKTNIPYYYIDVTDLIEPKTNPDVKTKEAK